MTTYEYEPLSDTKRQIRILSLFPRSRGAQLQGHLRIVDFDAQNDDSQPYEALSYVWGHDPVFSHVLHIDSASLKLTAHLANILQHIRLPDEERHLWIDAVCINQGDHTEQGSQVEMMGDIYRRCVRDLAWIGDPSSESVEVEEVVAEKVMEEESYKKLENGYRTFEAWLREFRGWSGRFERRIRDLTGVDSNTTGNNEEEDEEELDREHGYAYQHYRDSDYDDMQPRSTTEDGLAFIKELRRHGVTLGGFGGHGVPPGVSAKLEAVFCTRLWSRIWIVQELSCAKEVLLLTENQSLSWKEIRKFLARAQRTDIHHFPWGRGIVESGLAKIFFRAAEIDKQRDVECGSKGDDSTLLDVLARFCDRESTDSRDRVYGLLGLVPQKYRHVSVDYRISEAKLFVDVTAEIIRQTQNLDILCQSPWERRGVPQCSRLGGRTQDLPSWAVDFAAPELLWDVGSGYRSREIMFAGDKTRRIFSAGGDLTRDSWSFQDDMKVLKLHGVLVGRIGTYQTQPPADMGEVGRGSWGRDLTDGKYAATGEPKLQALLRTLVTDCSAYPMQRLRGDEIQLYVSAFREVLETGKNWFDAGLDLCEYGAIENMWGRIINNWAFFTGGEGLFILARKHVGEGDYISVIEGAKVPLILERVGHDGEGEYFEIVSPAYVHGFMDGEAFAPGLLGQFLKRELLIV